MSERLHILCIILFANKSTFTKTNVVKIKMVLMIFKLNFPENSYVRPYCKFKYNILMFKFCYLLTGADLRGESA